MAKTNVPVAVLVVGGVAVGIGYLSVCPVAGLAVAARYRATRGGRTNARNAVAVGVSLTAPFAHSPLAVG